MNAFILCLLVASSGLAQTEINFYAGIIEGSHRLNVDSAFCAKIKDTSGAPLKYFSIVKLTSNNFHYEYNRALREFNYVVIFRNGISQGLYLGEINKSCLDITIVVDTTKISNYPGLEFSYVDVNWFYRFGEDYPSKAKDSTNYSKRKLYPHHAKAHFVTEKEDHILSPGMKILDNLIFTSHSKTYFYLQSYYARDYSMNGYGIQLKRLNVDWEGDIGMERNQEFGIGFSQMEDQKFLRMDAGTSIGIFPYTLLFSLGAGLNYTARLHGPGSVLSVYPKIALSLGGLSIYYSYKLPLLNNLDMNYSRHGFTLALGPRIWSKRK